MNVTVNEFFNKCLFKDIKNLPAILINYKKFDESYDEIYDAYFTTKGKKRLLNDLDEFALCSFNPSYCQLVEETYLKPELASAEVENFAFLPKAIIVWVTVKDKE